jgi:4-amino-4-deoxy-L-arabinose transferase-like glycosyltransferase
MRELLRKKQIWVALAGIALFFPFLGSVHLFDWDEINFAECAREMLVLDEYLRVYIDYLPFWEKPPLFLWMQGASMHLWGVNEFAARFPNAVCGVVTLMVLFSIGKKLFNERFGFLWALAYAGSFFPNLYFKSGIIDPWFNLFIFLSLYFFIIYHWKRNDFDFHLPFGMSRYAMLAGLFMGLAMLTKGQVALIIFCGCLGVYWVYNRFRFFFGIWHVLLYLGIALLVTLTWYGYETAKNGPWFLSEFIKYQYRLLTTHDADQEGFIGYHYVVILFGCFPASLLAIPSFFKNSYKNRYERDLKVWMVILFWVVTLLFTFVKSRIIHYSSMAWFPVTFLAAYHVHLLLENRSRWKNYLTFLVAIIGGLIGILFALFPFVAMNIQKFIPYVNDVFARGNMEAVVNWTGFECLIGIGFVTLVWASLKWYTAGKIYQATWALFGGTAITIFLASAVIVPKVERYSQGAAIDFFKERAGEDCYVQVLGYKSYAHLFYAQKQPPQHPYASNTVWLLIGKLDKPAYFVSKVDRPEEFEPYPQLKELYRKNGFVFLKRENSISE